MGKMHPVVSPDKESPLSIVCIIVKTVADFWRLILQITFKDCQSNNGLAVILDTLWIFIQSFDRQIVINDGAQNACI